MCQKNKKTETLWVIGRESELSDLYIGPVNDFTLGVAQGGGGSEMFWIFCLRRFNISTGRFLVAVRLTFTRMLRQV